jgi:GMP synthase-like glutamine amidotransferase
LSERQKRALVIAHEPDGGAGQVGARLVLRGFVVDTHVVTQDYAQPNIAAPWPSFDQYDLILPMGSVRSMTRKEEIESWIYTELELLRLAHDNGTPILGICFGGQMLAETLGGSVEVAPETELGWYWIEAAPGAENPAGPGPWKEWHHDRFTPPVDADVLAVTENAVQLFRVGTSVGTQFHPEVDVAHITNWVAASDDDYLADLGVTRKEILEAAIEHEEHNIEQSHAFVDWFLDEVAFSDEAPERQPPAPQESIA